jgi:hypothetical protein
VLYAEEIGSTKASSDSSPAVLQRFENVKIQSVSPDRALTIQATKQMMQSRRSRFPICSLSICVRRKHSKFAYVIVNYKCKGVIGHSGCYSVMRYETVDRSCRHLRGKRSGAESVIPVVGGSVRDTTSSDSELDYELKTFDATKSDSHQHMCDVFVGWYEAYRQICADKHLLRRETLPLLIPSLIRICCGTREKGKQFLCLGLIKCAYRTTTLKQPSLLYY